MRSLTIGLLVCWIAARLLPGWASWCAALPSTADAPATAACCCSVEPVVLDDRCMDACCHSVGELPLAAVQPPSPTPIVVSAVALGSSWFDELLCREQRPTMRHLPPARDGPPPPIAPRLLRSVSLQI